MTQTHIRSLRALLLLLLCLAPALNALAGPETVTFNRDVLPILERNCQVCHRTGEIGAMPLLTFEETRPWAKAIKEAVLSRRMPPWFADLQIGHFKNKRLLSDVEVAAIVDWVDGGAPEGSAKAKPAEPPAVATPDGWSIEPDLIYEMSAPFAIPAAGALDYIYILLPAKFDKDTWIIDGEIQPGNRSAVHHASIIVRPPGSLWLKDARVGEPHVPPKEGEVALANFNAPNDWLLGYVPGMAPQRYFQPDGGAGRLIPAGSDIFLEIHYSSTGRKTEDRTKVGLVLAKQPPSRQLLNLVLYDTSFEIPPNVANYPGNTWAVLNEPATLVYMQPHLHMRGTSMSIRVTYPNGQSETLLAVPRYNYQWQVIYVLEQPLQLPKGTRIDVFATWDNSANNRFNPDPFVSVRVGQQVWNEMLVAILGVTVDRSVDAGKVVTLRGAP